MIVLLALWLTQLERAEALLREHRIDEAQQALVTALKEQPDSTSALLLQGRVAMARSDFDLARSSFERAASLAPRSASAQFLLGFFYYVDNDFVRARPVLERARELTPSDPRTTLFLALTYDGMAQPERAEPLFEEALRLAALAKRPSVEAHIAYARMLFSNGRFSDAQTQVTRALALAPNSREALYEQARLDLEAGRVTPCIANAERALNQEGEGVTPRQIHFLLSRAYAQAGNQERAVWHRRRFEEISPRLIR